MLMPVRNTVRCPSPNTYFHVYNRGVEKRQIFLDGEDYEFFLNLLNRRLCTVPTVNKTGKPYPHFRPQVTLLAYCLMPNHFHLVFHQAEDHEALSKLMASISVAYTMYFNRKHKRRGTLFETRFKASAIYDDSYLQHITRYVHLNPREYRTWPHSSYQAYLTPATCPDWLDPQPILSLFHSTASYIRFVDDYQAMHAQLETLKHELANY